ncbi:NTP transferase domain-containing protein [Lederbergia wuyishanensis]|uniref:Xanthine dehydrogenase accessory protein pucB n=1 Tax=Lederbergia wuyishanensis TaxID=1347903 RepID=A0ABU0DAF4_9BACI|nr:nucleotidyltransferase family protein [Lederbergia wuyishanensis]MCJ8010105.1 nucleotidyltransferase family protein [Lederbergia wuyishanensis]MDQ0345343.1 xanthine dehydrogenase accessory protein pucB [Lederbergia wuyishanensis]
MKIAGVYLAAGKSSRMGKNKLALPFKNTTIGNIALETALQSSLEKIYIVVSGEAPWLSSEFIKNPNCSIINCTNAHMGQSESLKCAIRLAQKEEVDAILVMLADQPLIPLHIIEEIMECKKKIPSLYFVAASFKSIIIPPVLLSSTMFPELLNLSGDTGAKALLHGDNFTKGRILPFNKFEYFQDIDTKEDYDKLLSGIK